ncbi:ribosome hibernation-promoting factor, HPF/YfiA family [Melioribacter sp. OK-6-Me]|uniref:ribosome hibernation-promoting factor, HPF/YfiA family n=1 Tax=unclassified Melioribacter TaxID=2627329 RepID=UPI003ED94546
MNIKITSRKFRAKDSLKNFIKEEIKSAEKFYDEILDVDVILSYTKPEDSIKTAEIIAQIPGKTLSVSHSSDDFEKSVSAAVEKLIRQLQKIKTQRNARKK